jgi:hypothetical protein
VRVITVHLPLPSSLISHRLPIGADAFRAYSPQLEGQPEGGRDVAVPKNTGNERPRTAFRFTVERPDRIGLSEQTQRLDLDRKTVPQAQPQARNAAGGMLPVLQRTADLTCNDTTTFTFML